MKKLFLIVSLALASVCTATAQNLAYRTEAGVNFSSFSLGENKKTDMVVGGRAGAAVEYGFSDNLFVSGGLNYKLTGGKLGKSDVKFLGTEVDLSTSTRSHSLTIPVNFGVRVPLGSGLAVSAEAGPYMGVLLAAKQYLGENSKDVIKSAKRVNAGLGVSASVEYQGAYLRLGTDIGLTNEAKSDDITSKTSEFYVGVGYRF